jgi:hypothetical protein
MKAPGGRGELLLILNLGTRLGWVVSITPRPHITPGTHCTGGWVGPRAGLDAEARGKILCLCRGTNPGRPVRSQTLYWLSYPKMSTVENTRCRNSLPPPPPHVLLHVNENWETFRIHTAESWVTRGDHVTQCVNKTVLTPSSCAPAGI